jgi:hypothetical protein
MKTTPVDGLVFVVMNAETKEQFCSMAVAETPEGIAVSIVIDGETTFEEMFPAGRTQAITLPLQRVEDDA